MATSPLTLVQLGRTNRGALVKCLKFSTFFGSGLARIELVQKLVVAPRLSLRGHLANQTVENAEQFRAGLRGIEQQALGMQFAEAAVLGALTPLLKPLGAGAPRTFAQRRQQIA
jgi:hypothetical protein